MRCRGRAPPVPLSSLSSVVGSSRSTSAQAKPSQTAIGRSGQRIVERHRHATIASSGAPAPPSSSPTSAGGRIDHVGVVPLAGDLTASEESALKVFLRWLPCGVH
jgi:hypothetical protein